jgi:hypothetical protein
MKWSDNGQQVRMAARFDDLSMSPRTELVIASARNYAGGVPPYLTHHNEWAGSVFLDERFAQTTRVVISVP